MIGFWGLLHHYFGLGHMLKKTASDSYIQDSNANKTYLTSKRIDFLKSRLISLYPKNSRVS